MLHLEYLLLRDSSQYICNGFANIYCHSCLGMVKTERIGFSKILFFLCNYFFSIHNVK